jgi:hypothetical protein
MIEQSDTTNPQSKIRNLKLSQKADLLGNPKAKLKKFNHG